MTRTTVLEVQAAPASDVLLGGAIDTPAGGDERPDWSLDVRGWAIGVDARAVAIEAIHEGQRLWRVPVDVARPRTAAEHPGAPDDTIGFHALAGTLQLAPRFDVEVSAVLGPGVTAPIASIRGRRTPLRSSFEPRRSPLMVTTLGRTGSMLLMRLLSAHPEVLVYRPHRFEQRIASYWADVLLSLAEPAGYIRQIAPPPDVDDPAWWLGRGAPVPWGLRDAPVQQWLGGDAVEDLAVSFQQRIEALYDRIVATTDTADAPMFAEKCNLRAAGVLAELYPESREIFLVRDFRDMVSSILSFNAQRGAAGFGRGGAASDADYVSSLGGWATGLLCAWERRRDSAHLVRYEDLVMDQERTLAGILDYLGIDSGSRTVAALRAGIDEQLPELADHATTDGPEASVGRWREDLTPDLAQRCERALAPALAAFGYD
jgi:hypothetical protein